MTVGVGGKRGDVRKRKGGGWERGYRSKVSSMCWVMTVGGIGNKRGNIRKRKGGRKGKECGSNVRGGVPCS
jgi:hypothetical protein